MLMTRHSSRFREERYAGDSTVQQLDEKERRLRMLAAVLCFAIGLYLWYSVWSRQPGWHVSPPIGYLCAGMFLAAGANMLLQLRGFMRGQLVTAFLIAAAMTGIAGWISLGPGPRQCTGSFGFLSVLPPESLCRGVFGFGTLLMALLAVAILRSLFKSEPASSGPV